MKKSIIIIGKGPSVLQSTREFVESFDEVAICNFPPMNGYEKHIGTKAQYLFLNAGDPNPYDKSLLNSLGLTHAFNTSHKPKGREDKFCPAGVTYDGHYGEKRKPQFKKDHGFDPSTGILAFDYFVRNSGYDTIGLIGFDLFKVGTPVYYFSKDAVQSSLHYLFSPDGHRPYTPEGIIKKESSHGSTEHVFAYINSMLERFSKNSRVPWEEKVESN